MTHESNQNDNHVAWCHYTHSGKATVIRVCNSGTPGAFKVYRRPETSDIKRYLKEAMSLLKRGREATRRREWEKGETQEAWFDEAGAFLKELKQYLGQ